MKLVCIQNLRKGIFKKYYDIPYFDGAKFVEGCFKISWIFLFFIQFVLTSFDGPSIFVALYISGISMSWSEEGDSGSSSERGDRRPQFSRYNRAVSTYPAASMALVIKTNISSVCARSTGKRPLQSTQVKFAQESMSKLVILQWPEMIAKCSGLQPFLSFPSMLAPWSRSNITKARLPSRQLCCNGVKPYLFFSLIAICLPPYFNKNFTLATSPSTTAWLKITLDAEGQRESSLSSLGPSIRLKINRLIYNNTLGPPGGKRKSDVNKNDIARSVLIFLPSPLTEFESLMTLVMWRGFDSFGLIYLRTDWGGIYQQVVMRWANRSYLRMKSFRHWTVSLFHLSNPWQVQILVCSWMNFLRVGWKFWD